jgi:hypothetical protein
MVRRNNDRKTPIVLKIKEYLADQTTVAGRQRDRPKA